MLILIAIWAIAGNWLAWSKGFYTLPKESKPSIPSISTFSLLTSFGIYLIVSFLLTPLFARFVLWSMHQANPEISSLSTTFIAGLQFSSMLVIFLLLITFIYRQNSLHFFKIWKDKTPKPTSPAEFDFGLGMITWFLSFPIVTVLSELVDKILKSFFGLKIYEQTAVRFVKVAMDSPTSLIFALLSVLVLAPLIEEFLFRGILQTYFKKRLGIYASILLSALCFSLFHFSPNQGLGNVSLVLSLFILGGFLGFLYERQRSLWACIGLHAAFNSISALRILFFPEVVS